jgi:hypothetical protein
LVRKFIFNDSKSSSLKTSHDNGHILGAAKAADILYAEQEHDIQQLSMMPGHGSLLLYRDLQSLYHVVPGVTFLSMVPSLLLHKVAVINEKSRENKLLR